MAKNTWQALITINKTIKNKTIRTLTIDRAKWGENSLLDSGTKQMCCLGHLGLACGVPKEKLENELMPQYLKEEYLYPIAFRKGHPSKAAYLASHINDDPRMSKPEKERRLIILFAAYRLKLKFVGDIKLAGV